MYSTNHDMKSYLEERLDHWARWMLKGQWGGLGYPTQSILYDWLKRGCVGIKMPRSRRVPYNEAAEEIEAYVVELSRQEPKPALALCIYYLSRGTIEHKAKEMRTSLAQFKIYLNMG